MAVHEDIFHLPLKAEVSKYATEGSFPAGTTILSEHAYINAIPIVLKGSLRVMRTDEDGKEILLYYIKPGESCIMSFLGGIHNEASQVTAEVEEDSDIIFIPVEKAGEWVRQFPEWSDYIFKLYHKRFEELLSVVNAVAFQKLDTRLLQLLEQKVALHHAKELKITHQQLADELGTAREAVSRILKQMENDGLLKLGRNKISLV